MAKIQDASTAEAATNQGRVVASRALRVVGEKIAPGGSLILDGDIKNGAIHMVAAVAARSLLGPFGRFLVGANSYSRSVTGKHLLQHVQKPAQ